MDIYKNIKFIKRDFEIEEKSKWVMGSTAWPKACHVILSEQIIYGPSTVPNSSQIFNRKDKTNKVGPLLNLF